MHVAIAVLVLLGAGADPIDKEKLRQGIRLPTTTIGWRTTVSSSGIISLLDEEARAQEKIAVEEKALSRDPLNAARWSALSDLYYQANQTDKADAATQKAAALYRPQVVARPLDGLLLTRYADCLECRDDKQRDEVEALFRQAVCLAPTEWECWLNLAVMLETKATKLLQNIDPDGGSLPPPLEKFRKEMIFPEIVAQAQERYTESLHCYDRCVSLAPREPMVYLARAGFHNNRAIVSLMHKFQCGDDLGERPFGPLTDCCADLWRAARLKPDDERVQGIAAVYEMTTAMSGCKGSPTGLAMLSAKGKAQVESVIAHLESKAAGKSRQAASAAEVLGLLYLYLGNIDKMSAQIQRAVRLNPALDQAWDLWLAFLATEKKTAECLAASQERLKQNDTPRNRFLLAKAYEDANRLEEAEPILERALRYHPNDVVCNLSLAALLMRKDKAPAMARAGALLDRAEQQLRAHPVEADVLNHAVLRITLDALDGQFEAARSLLAKLTPKQRADKRVKELVDLLESKHPAIAVP